jgi:cytochrome P450
MHIETGIPNVPADPRAFDLADPAAYAAGSAHGLWRLLREVDPVRRDLAPNGTPYWSFFRYAECEPIVADTRRFSSQYGTILASVGAEDPAGGKTITLMDPPEHATIRRPATRKLGPAAVRRHRQEVREGVVRLIKPLLDGGEHDVATVLRSLPMVGAGPLMGIAERHWDTVAFNATASIAPSDPEFSAGRNSVDTLRRAHHHLFASFSDTIERCRSRAGDDLVSELLAYELDGHRLDQHTLLLNCYSFALGANSTTSHVASQLLLALAERPALWESVIDEPASIPALVSEAVRWASPTNHLVRRMTEDCELGGARLRAGDWVCAWVASANRDEDVFSSPYEFELRSPNPHLGFGLGPHFCVGASVSKLLLESLVEELASRRLRFAVRGAVTHLTSNWINGITSLPMSFTPMSA